MGECKRMYDLDWGSCTLQLPSIKQTITKTNKQTNKQANNQTNKQTTDVGSHPYSLDVLISHEETEKIKYLFHVHILLTV